MNTQRICCAVTFIITVAISAQTPEEAVHFLENESGIGVKAQAMGNSYVGLANDYSAIYWNPAGLTQLKTSEFTGSFCHMIFNNEANFSLGMAVNFYSGSSQYGLDLYQDDIDDVYYQFPANFNSYELHESILSQFSGWGVKLGGLFELNRDIRIGLAVDLPTKLKVLETYSSHDVLTFDDEFISEMDLGEGEWEYVVKYPIKFGAAFPSISGSYY